MINAKLFAKNHCIVWYKIRNDGSAYRMYCDKTLELRFNRRLKYGINYPNFGYLSTYNVSASATDKEKLFSIMSELSKTYNFLFEWIDYEL